MKINIHAGHNPDGKIGCGAVGLIKESTEARKVKDEVIRLLNMQGVVTNDCTVNNGTSQSDVLVKIIGKTKKINADLDVSIHFNAGASDTAGNNKTTGTEILVYSSSSSAVSYAKKVLSNIEKLGFKNRGIKYRADLYVLKMSKAPAMLVECCFVDDKDDVNCYNYKTMAKAIAEGIIGKTITEKEDTKEEVKATENTKEEASVILYKVQCGAFSDKKNAESLAEKLKKAGFSATIVKQ